MAARRIDPDAGEAALAALPDDPAALAAAPREVLATAVRYTLQLLAERAPGRSVEVRVPPFGAVQCLEGPGHTRGTPSNVIETDAATWLALALGLLGWEQARASGRLSTSGIRADLEPLLPVVVSGGERNRGE